MEQVPLRRSSRARARTRSGQPVEEREVVRRVERSEMVLVFWGVGSWRSRGRARWVAWGGVGDWRERVEGMGIILSAEEEEVVGAMVVRGRGGGLWRLGNWVVYAMLC